MKKIVLIALVALVIPCSGQTITQKVPVTAQYVFTLNTPNILSKMSLVEMGKLPIVHEAVQKFVRQRKGARRSRDMQNQDRDYDLNGLGFDFKQASYAFVETTDSVTYIGYLVALNDKAAFEALNDSSMKMVNIGKKVKAIGKRKELIVWNKKMALFIGATKKSSYFREHPEVYERYGMEPDTSGSNYYNHYGRYDDQNEIVKIWLKDKAKNIFAKKSKKIGPHKFTKYTDNKAACSVWSSSGSFYSQYMNMIGGILDPKNGTQFPGGDLVYHMYINEKDITMKSSITLEEKDFSSYQNIFNNKVNPKFFDYIDADHFLSYYSQAYSVQGALEEVPHLVNSYLGNHFDKWGIQESVDLLAVVLDEEAIGKVVVGDAMLILTDIGEEEVTYIDYEWDEDYILRKEVEKTKKELMPEFLYMMSTKDEASVHKIFKLSMKANKKRFTKEDGYYQLIPYRNAPFKVYFVVKNGIIFMVNAKAQLDAILSDKAIKRLDAATIKSIIDSPLMMAVDGKRIVENVPRTKATTPRKEREQKMLEYTQENIGSLTVKQNFPTKNALSAEVIYSFTNGAGNGLKYFMHFINDLYEIEKKRE